MGQRNGNGQSNLREFGKFRLDAEKCVLWHLGRPVELQPKEIELLSVLTESPGEVVTKRELMDRVWANSFVEESNLSRHIYKLRRTFESYGLDGGVIQTVPRRGYRFTGEIELTNTDYVIERHSISRTLIEELHTSVEPVLKQENTLSVWNAPLKYVMVSIIAISVYAVAVSLFFGAPVPPADRTMKLIAVLPFRSSDEPSDKALGLGFADALSTSLGGLRNVRALSPHSTYEYVAEKLDPNSSGRELGVDAVVDGILQRANGSLRATIRLTRIGDGQILWSDIFEGPDNDVFGLQDRIALSATKAIADSLKIQNRETAFNRYTKNSDAYQAYLTGKFLHYQHEFPRAIAEFERALQLDSKYVPAIVGLADSNAVLANSKTGQERIALFEKAKRYALQSIALDQELAEAHASLGWIRRIYDWDWAESEKHLSNALELDPNASAVYQRLSLLFVTLGKTDEAVKLASKAKQLNPVNHSVAWALYCDRQYQASAAEYERRMSLSSAPSVIADGRLGKAMALIELGNNEEAIRLLDGFDVKEQKQFRIAVILAIARFKAGQKELATSMLRDLEMEAKINSGRWVRLAYVYATMGMEAEFLDALEKGLADRDDRLMWIKTTPYFDRYRDEPRFKSIVARMGLPE